jgi:ubiquinone/menaquinone biosynthesis C-methylase UbiE
METEIQYWISDQENEEIFSSKYWNDEEEEAKKEWYILNGNSHKLISYLKEKSTLFDEYESVIRFAEDKNCQVKGYGVDIAAGVCWTTALLSRNDMVEKIYAVELSKHRLLRVAPAVFELFNASKSKIIRILGSFYSLKFSDESIDFCLMSQAFHHASETVKMLAEVRRVLKPNGFILIIGETPISNLKYFRAFVKNFIKMSMPLPRFRSTVIYKFLPSIQDLFPANATTGDHHYHILDYYRIFHENGFRLIENKQRNFTTFVALKA